MALTPEQIAAALNRGTGDRTRSTGLDPIERKRRALAQQRAQQDARNALARMFPEEYKELYAAAIQTRMETTTVEQAKQRLEASSE